MLAKETVKNTGTYGNNAQESLKKGKQKHKKRFSKSDNKQHGCRYRKSVVDERKIDDMNGNVNPKGQASNKYQSSASKADNTRFP